jgi:hypothetical protein
MPPHNAKSYKKKTTSARELGQVTIAASIGLCKRIFRRSYQFSSVLPRSYQLLYLSVCSEIVKLLSLIIHQINQRQSYFYTSCNHCWNNNGWQYWTTVPLFPSNIEETDVYKHDTLSLNSSSERNCPTITRKSWC